MDEPFAPAASPAELHFDAGLIQKYDGFGPRYTSYPTADRFHAGVGASQYVDALAARSDETRPLSLYVHLPFCNTVCYYCACTKIITANRGRSAKYVRYLGREIALVSSLLEGERSVSQLHWGGGTPTFLAHAEMADLMRMLRDAFPFAADTEASIEIDPRKVDTGTIAFLRELGFNRVSFGIQDFDPAVQRAVNRIQSEEETRSVVTAARASGFASVNTDLIYGLPLQTVEGFAITLDKVIDIAPDRIALYGYAHVPHLFKAQRQIVADELPAADTKLAILATAIEKLTRAGYVYIGMDHFARPGDELAVAQRKGFLTRDFQGYSAGGDCDLAAFGTSAIGKIGPAYMQNAKTLDTYYQALDQGELPIVRGIQLTADDIVRRAVIQALACQFAVCKESIGISHLLDFDDYFAAEMADLRKLEDDGLVELDDEWITVTPRGRLLVRAVCSVFDKYLRATVERKRYSRIV